MSTNFFEIHRGPLRDFLQFAYPGLKPKFKARLKRKLKNCFRDLCFSVFCRKSSESMSSELAGSESIFYHKCYRPKNKFSTIFISTLCINIFFYIQGGPIFAPDFDR